MSKEQDKESIALKRVRSDDSGLEWLQGPEGIQLGSSDKKNAQGPSFPQEAPPPNPNSDHLVAANPFHTISYKPLPWSN